MDEKIATRGVRFQGVLSGGVGKSKREIFFSSLIYILNQIQPFQELIIKSHIMPPLHMNLEM